MAFDSDVSVKGVAANATTVVNASRARLKGFIISPGANTSTVSFTDGGVEKFNVSVTGATSDVAMNIPEQGVVFKTNLAVNTANTTASVTVFYTGA
jgi:hypothetical protein